MALSRLPADSCRGSLKSVKKSLLLLPNARSRAAEISLGRHGAAREIWQSSYTTLRRSSHDRKVSGEPDGAIRASLELDWCGHLEF
jgi:hypothetical protein